MSIGVYFKLATRIVRTFTNFYLFVIENPRAMCERLLIVVCLFQTQRKVRNFIQEKGVHSTGHEPYGERYNLKLLNPWLVKQIDFSLAIVRSVKGVHS